MSTKKNFFNPLKTGFIGLLFVLSNYAFATSYYVENNGNDNADGKTEATAWKTLDKVNASTFSPGDKILFKKGNIWHGRLKVSNSGSAGNPIVYSAYGSGDKPIIRDIFQQNLSWSSYDTNIWRAPISFKLRRLWEGNTELHRAYLLDPFKDLGPSFSFAYKDGYVYLYKTSTPSSSNYSFRKIGSALSLSGRSYITIDNLDLQGGETSIYANDCKYITITNSNIGKDSFVGIEIGGAHNKILHNTLDSHWSLDDTNAYVGRNSDSRGCEDGIHMTHTADDIEIAHNTLKDWGHSHIYSYDSRSNAIHDIYIHHNYFSTENADYGKGFDILGNTHNVEMAYNHFYKVTGASDFNGHDNHFHHNLMEHTKHYSIRGSSGKNGYALNTNNGNSDVYNNIIENNIFAYSDSEAMTVNAYSSNGYYSHDIIIRNNILYKNGDNSISGIDTPSLSIWNTQYLSKVTVENNLIVHAGSSNMIRYNGTTVSSISAFNNATEVAGDNIEGNIISDPQFASETNYTIQNESVATAYNIDVSLIGPEGGPAETTPVAAPTKMGAFVMDRSGLH